MLTVSTPTAELIVDRLTELLLTQPVLYVLALAYLSGSVPYGFLMARTFANTDVREQGSGNIGATNVARVVGKKMGLLTAFLDIFKGMLPALIVKFWAPTQTGLLKEEAFLLTAMVGAAAFIGHCFPVWLKFKGGKGVATGAGVIAVIDPTIFSMGALVFFMTFAATRMVSLSSIFGALALCIAVFALLPVDISLSPLMLMLLILIFKHRSNISRILKKEEMAL